MVRQTVGLSEMGFLAPGAAKGRDLVLTAYEEAGVCADWGPWRKGRGGYEGLLVGRWRIFQAHCSGVECCGSSLFQESCFL